MKDNQALIVVDVQKDFLETGALPVRLSRRKRDNC